MWEIQAPHLILLSSALPARRQRWFAGFCEEPCREAWNRPANLTYTVIYPYCIKALSPLGRLCHNIYVNGDPTVQEMTREGRDTRQREVMHTQRTQCTDCTRMHSLHLSGRLKVMSTRGSVTKPHLYEVVIWTDVNCFLHSDRAFLLQEPFSEPKKFRCVPATGNRIYIICDPSFSPYSRIGTSCLTKNYWVG